jgi:threonine/homoserine/homoserine lactone efflux protein
MDALLFFPLAVMIALTPGPNNFCALNNGLRQGVLAALAGALGRILAFAIFLTVSAFGLGAMLLASQTAFNLLKWLGAAYLFWLGWRAWHSRDLGGMAAEGVRPQGQAPGETLRTTRQLATQEFLLGISNPKAMLLFAAIFPQFINPQLPAARQFLVLGSTYLLAELVSAVVYGSGGTQIRRLVRSPQAVIRLNRATGGFFAGAAGLLLASHR